MFVMQRVFILVFALVIVSAHTATGRTGSPRTTISVSAFSLYHPVVEVFGEFRIKRTMSLTGIAGAGGSDGSTILEVGGQYNYFVGGDFNSGIHLGLETVYASISPLLDNSPLSIENGLSTGLFLGYKSITYIGLTFDMQVGLAGVMDTDRENNSSSFKFVGGKVIFRTNFGWSF